MSWQTVVCLLSLSFIIVLSVSSSSSSGRLCLGVSAPGSGTCWGSSWSPPWIFLVLNMSIQVRFKLNPRDLEEVAAFGDSKSHFVSFQDVLLCHDDELEGRRVAFILYLVPPWQSTDGGSLDLYSTDSRYLCVCVCAQLYC